jgi:hypothetical protein
MHSSRLCLEFPGSEFGEIGDCGTLEALLAVEGGVDLVIRNSKPILRREVFYESFGELVVGGSVFVGHRGDSVGEAVTEPVHAGTVAAGLRFKS